MRLCRRLPRTVLYYPGLLVSENILSALNEFCYCPTALDLPTLNYEEDGKQVNVLVIGDPTQPGPNINDGSHAGLPGEC